MPVTVNVNDLSVIHQTSNGIATATIPDVCQTPSPSGPVPIPYPNVAMSMDLVAGTTTVTIDGSSAAIQGSKFVKSTGDEAGVAGGVASAVFAMEATFLSFSPTVTLDGKPACRLTDKMLMNKGNTVCMGGAVNPFLAPAGPDAMSGLEISIDPDQPKLCVLRGIFVGCGHSDRGVSIDLAKKEHLPFQVISKAGTPDHLVVEWDGTCGAYHPFCPSVGVTHKGDWALVDKAKATFDVPAQELSLFRDWFAIFKALVSQKNVPCDYYTIGGRVCMGNDVANVGAGQWLQVQVFPEVEWKADFSIGYSHKLEKGADKKDKPFHYEPESTWIVGGSAEAKFGRDKFTYSLDSGVKADALPLFGSLLGKIGKCAKIFESMAKIGLPVKLEPKWPSWKFGGGLKLVELPHKLIVGSEGNFKFEFDPLFGMELEVSILDWLIKFAGGLAGPPGIALAVALTKIRKRLAEGAGSKETAAQAKLDIDIVIKVSGEIKGGFGLKFLEGKGEVDPEAAMVEASMGVSINGHVIGKARVWRVEASGAVQVGSAGADGKEPSKFGGRLKPKGGSDAFTPAGQLFFTGLAVYYLAYAEAGLASDETNEGEADGDPETTHKKGWSEKVETRGTCVLIEAWTHPKGSA